MCVCVSSLIYTDFVIKARGKGLKAIVVITYTIRFAYLFRANTGNTHRRTRSETRPGIKTDRPIDRPANNDATTREGYNSLCCSLLMCTCVSSFSSHTRDVTRRRHKEGRARQHHIYIYIYVCVCVCVCVSISIYTCTHTHTRAFI